MFTMTGQYNEALITARNPEQSALDQVQAMINHRAFKGERLVFMPDMHPGKGAIVGTTFPLNKNTLRIAPGVIGVDIGCGVLAACLGELNSPSDLPLTGAELDRALRQVIPMGSGIHGSAVYSMKHDFPYDRAEETLTALGKQLGRRITPEDWDHLGGYDYEYFRALCRRADESYKRAEKSLGTLGGGNHFIELAQPEQSNELWVIIHSGSRGIGKETAEYWKHKATRKRGLEQIRAKLEKTVPEQYYQFLKFDPRTVSDTELRTWLNGEKEGEEGYVRLHSDGPSRPGVHDVYTGLKRQNVLSTLRGLAPDSSRDNDLDYFKGNEVDGYLGDLNFLQWYARENRRIMLNQVAKLLERPIQEKIECIHNYISFRDGILRKGATPARDGQRIVIPMNMRDGTLVARGKNNAAWNHSAPHGAGRIMSRNEGKQRLNNEEARKIMDGVYTDRLPPDELPQNYKDMVEIMEAIEPTAHFEQRLVPFHNFKA